MTNNNDGDDGDGNYETIPEIFLEGLTHDVLILNKLLKRHRCSHGRTIYFRRMNMTLKCLLQTQRMIMVENVHRLKELQKNINQYHQELNRKKKKQKRQPREEEEEWNLQQLKPTLTASNNKTTAKVSVSQLTVLIEEFQKLIYVWTQQIPEILSRIQHSSIALIKEISRGFFLPFCTVAIGSLARIRTIVMEIIGVHGLTILYNLQSELMDIILHQKQHQQGDNNNEHMTMMMTDATYAKCMNMFLENNSNNFNDTTNHQDTIVDRSAILRSLGLMESQSTTSKSKSGKQNNNNDTATTTTTTDMENFDHYALSASASLSHPPIKLYHEDELDESYIDDDDDDNNNIDSAATSNDDNIADRNMAMVDSYQKRRQQEHNNKSNVSNKKRKSTTTTTTATATATIKGSMHESSLSQKKKKKKKDKNRKEKSKNKTDFFDQLFD